MDDNNWNFFDKFGDLDDWLETLTILENEMDQFKKPKVKDTTETESNTVGETLKNLFGKAQNDKKTAQATKKLTEEQLAKAQKKQERMQENFEYAQTLKKEIDTTKKKIDKAKQNQTNAKKSEQTQRDLFKKTQDLTQKAQNITGHYSYATAKNNAPTFTPANIDKTKDRIYSTVAKGKENIKYEKPKDTTPLMKGLNNQITAFGNELKQTTATTGQTLNIGLNNKTQNIYSNTTVADWANKVQDALYFDLETMINAQAVTQVAARYKDAGVERFVQQTQEQFKKLQDIKTKFDKQGANALTKEEKLDLVQATQYSAQTKNGHSSIIARGKGFDVTSVNKNNQAFISALDTGMETLKSMRDDPAKYTNVDKDLNAAWKSVEKEIQKTYQNFDISNTTLAAHNGTNFDIPWLRNNGIKVKDFIDTQALARTKLNIGQQNDSKQALVDYTLSSLGDYYKAAATLGINEADYHTANADTQIMQYITKQLAQEAQRSGITNAQLTTGSIFSVKSSKFANEFSRSFKTNDKGNAVTTGDFAKRLVGSGDILEFLGLKELNNAKFATFKNKLDNTQVNLEYSSLSDLEAMLGSMVKDIAAPDDAAKQQKLMQSALLNKLFTNGGGSLLNQFKSIKNGQKDNQYVSEYGKAMYQQVQQYLGEDFLNQYIGLKDNFQTLDQTQLNEALRRTGKQLNLVNRKELNPFTLQNLVEGGIGYKLYDKKQAAYKFLGQNKKLFGGYDAKTGKFTPNSTYKELVNMITNAYAGTGEMLAGANPLNLFYEKFLQEVSSNSSRLDQFRNLNSYFGKQDLDQLGTEGFNQTLSKTFAAQAQKAGNEIFSHQNTAARDLVAQLYEEGDETLKGNLTGNLFKQRQQFIGAKDAKLIAAHNFNPETKTFGKDTSGLYLNQIVEELQAQGLNTAVRIGANNTLDIGAWLPSETDIMTAGGQVDWSKALLASVALSDAKGILTAKGKIDSGQYIMSHNDKTNGDSMYGISLIGGVAAQFKAVRDIVSREHEVDDNGEWVYTEDEHGFKIPKLKTGAPGSVVGRLLGYNRETGEYDKIPDRQQAQSYARSVIQSAIEGSVGVDRNYVDTNRNNYTESTNKLISALGTRDASALIQNLQKQYGMLVKPKGDKVETITDPQEISGYYNSFMSFIAAKAQNTEKYVNLENNPFANYYNRTSEDKEEMAKISDFRNMIDTAANNLSISNAGTATGSWSEAKFSAVSHASSSIAGAFGDDSAWVYDQQAKGLTKLMGENPNALQNKLFTPMDPNLPQQGLTEQKFKGTGMYDMYKMGQLTEDDVLQAAVYAVSGNNAETQDANWKLAQEVRAGKITSEANPARYKQAQQIFQDIVAKFGVLPTIATGSDQYIVSNSTLAALTGVRNKLVSVTGQSKAAAKAFGNMEKAQKIFGSDRTQGDVKFDNGYLLANDLDLGNGNILRAGSLLDTISYRKNDQGEDIYTYALREVVEGMDSTKIVGSMAKGTAVGIDDELVKYINQIKGYDKDTSVYKEATKINPKNTPMLIEGRMNYLVNEAMNTVNQATGKKYTAEEVYKKMEGVSPLLSKIFTYNKDTSDIGLTRNVRATNDTVQYLKQGGDRNKEGDWVNLWSSAEEASTQMQKLLLYSDQNEFTQLWKGLGLKGNYEHKFGQTLTSLALADEYRHWYANDIGSIADDLFTNGTVKGSQFKLDDRMKNGLMRILGANIAYGSGEAASNEEVFANQMAMTAMKEILGRKTATNARAAKIQNEIATSFEDTANWSNWSSAVSANPNQKYIRITAGAMGDEIAGVTADEMKNIFTINGNSLIADVPTGKNGKVNKKELANLAMSQINKYIEQQATVTNDTSWRNAKIVYDAGPADSGAFTFLPNIKSDGKTIDEGESSIMRLLKAVANGQSWDTAISKYRINMANYAVSSKSDLMEDLRKTPTQNSSFGKSTGTNMGFEDMLKNLYGVENMAFVSENKFRGMFTPVQENGKVDTAKLRDLRLLAAQVQGADTLKKYDEAVGIKNFEELVSKSGLTRSDKVLDITNRILDNLVQNADFEQMIQQGPDKAKAVQAYLARYPFINDQNAVGVRLAINKKQSDESIRFGWGQAGIMHNDFDGDFNALWSMMAEQAGILRSGIDDKQLNEEQRFAKYKQIYKGNENVQKRMDSYVEAIKGLSKAGLLDPNFEGEINPTTTDKNIKKIDSLGQQLFDQKINHTGGQANQNNFTKIGQISNVASNIRSSISLRNLDFMNGEDLKTAGYSMLFSGLLSVAEQDAISSKKVNERIKAQLQASGQEINDKNIQAYGDKELNTLVDMMNQRGDYAKNTRSKNFMNAFKRMGELGILDTDDSGNVMFGGRIGAVALAQMQAMLPSEVSNEIFKELGVSRIQLDESGKAQGTEKDFQISVDKLMKHFGEDALTKIMPGTKNFSPASETHDPQYVAQRMMDRYTYLQELEKEQTENEGAVNKVFEKFNKTKKKKRDKGKTNRNQTKEQDTQNPEESKTKYNQDKNGETFTATGNSLIAQVTDRKYIGYDTEGNHLYNYSYYDPKTRDTIEVENRKSVNASMIAANSFIEPEDFASKFKKPSTTAAHEGDFFHKLMETMIGQHTANPLYKKTVNGEEPGLQQLSAEQELAIAGKQVTATAKARLKQTAAITFNKIIDNVARGIETVAEGATPSTNAINQAKNYLVAEQEVRLVRNGQLTTARADLWDIWSGAFYDYKTGSTTDDPTKLAKGKVQLEETKAQFRDELAFEWQRYKQQEEQINGKTLSDDKVQAIYEDWADMQKNPLMATIRQRVETVMGQGADRGAIEALTKRLTQHSLDVWNDKNGSRGYIPTIRNSDGQMVWVETALASADEGSKRFDKAAAIGAKGGEGLAFNLTPEEQKMRVQEMKETYAKSSAYDIKDFVSAEDKKYIDEATVAYNTIKDNNAKMAKYDSWISLLGNGPEAQETVAFLQEQKTKLNKDNDAQQKIVDNLKKNSMSADAKAIFEEKTEEADRIKEAEKAALQIQNQPTADEKARNQAVRNYRQIVKNNETQAKAQATKNEIEQIAEAQRTDQQKIDLNDANTRIANTTKENTKLQKEINNLLGSIKSEDVKISYQNRKAEIDYKNQKAGKTEKPFIWSDNLTKLDSLERGIYKTQQEKTKFEEDGKTEAAEAAQKRIDKAEKEKQKYLENAKKLGQEDEYNKQLALSKAKAKEKVTIRTSFDSELTKAKADYKRAQTLEQYIQGEEYTDDQKAGFKQEKALLEERYKKFRKKHFGSDETVEPSKMTLEQATITNMETEAQLKATKDIDKEKQAALKLNQQQADYVKQAIAAYKEQLSIEREIKHIEEEIKNLKGDETGNAKAIADAQKRVETLQAVKAQQAAIVDTAASRIDQQYRYAYETQKGTAQTASARRYETESANIVAKEQEGLLKEAGANYKRIQELQGTIASLREITGNQAAYDPNLVNQAYLLLNGDIKNNEVGYEEQLKQAEEKQRILDTRLIAGGREQDLNYTKQNVDADVVKAAQEARVKAIEKEAKAAESAEASNISKANTILKEKYKLEEDILRLQSKVTTASQGENKLYAEEIAMLKAKINLLDAEYAKVTGLVTSESGKAAIKKQENVAWVSHQAATKDIQATAKQNVGFLDKLIGGFKQQITWMIDRSLAYSAIGYVKQGFQTLLNDAAQLDSAMVNIQIATGKTREATREMLGDYNEIASELGRTTQEVATASNDWLRAGYDGEEAAELTKASMTLSTLGQIESANATSYLISTLKGWKIEAEDVMGVVDKLTVIICGVYLVIGIGHKFNCR